MMVNKVLKRDTTQKYKTTHLNHKPTATITIDIRKVSLNCKIHDT